jgi:transposase InsO family protein
MAYRFMQESCGRYGVKEMAGLLGVSRSAYYQWAKGGKPGRRGEADAELIRLIREIVTKHRRRYGSPRVRQELRQVYGKRVSLKKVARLMRENSLNARYRRKYIPTTDSRHGLPACENILNRDFYATGAGQKRVSDIT